MDIESCDTNPKTILGDEWSEELAYHLLKKYREVFTIHKDSKEIFMSDDVHWTKFMNLNSVFHSAGRRLIKEMKYLQIGITDNQLHITINDEYNVLYFNKNTEEAADYIEFLLQCGVETLESLDLTNYTHEFANDKMSITSVNNNRIIRQLRNLTIDVLRMTQCTCEDCALLMGKAKSVYAENSFIACLRCHMHFDFMQISSSVFEKSLRMTGPLFSIESPHHSDYINHSIDSLSNGSQCDKMEFVIDCAGERVPQYYFEQLIRRLRVKELNILYRPRRRVTYSEDLLFTQEPNKRPWHVKGEKMILKSLSLELYGYLGNEKFAHNHLKSVVDDLSHFFKTDLLSLVLHDVLEYEQLVDSILNRQLFEKLDENQQLRINLTIWPLPNVSMDNRNKILLDRLKYASCDSKMYIKMIDADDSRLSVKVVLTDRKDLNIRFDMKWNDSIVMDLPGFPIVRNWNDLVMQQEF